MHFCGIDIGSRTSKIVVLKNREIIYSKVTMTGLFPADTAKELEVNARIALGLSDNAVMPVVATGYGRNQVEAGLKIISEISCHAKGVNYFFPEAELVIDIGGQDSKGILVDKEGRAIDFVMNDRCAAGSGRFLEKVAEILEINVGQLGELVESSSKVVEVNSTCVVFAESEIIGLIAKGESPASIAAGVHLALARRTRNLTASLADVQRIVFTGGVARNSAMVKSLEKVYGREILVPENPEITGAIGAAIYAENAGK